MIVIGLFLILPFLVVLTLWFYFYYNAEKHLKHIPGPTPLPIVGNLHQFGPVIDEIHKFFEYQTKYGNVYKARIAFDKPSLFITDTKLIEEILRSSNILEKADTYKFFHSWLGLGLLTSSNEKWKKHRKMLTPAFHFKILEQFIEVFNKYSELLLNKLEEELDKTSVDIYLHVTLCTLDIICATSMGTNVHAQENSDSKYVTTVKEICEVIAARTSSILKTFDFTFSFTSDYQKQKKALQYLHNFTNSVIASRKKELARNNIIKENHEDFGIKQRLTFLDTMLQYKEDGNFISYEDIRQEVDTFMFEGHDTTSAGISFILYSLAQNPDIQEKVVEELNSIFVDKNQQATYQDFQEMKYLEMVIKESLRLFPPVPMFGRSLSEDTQFENYFIPKGTELFIFPYALHRDPNIYKNPETFDPERFSPENQSKRPTYAYIPFSAGPRNCIGQRFAMLEMKSVTSKVLRKFEILPATPVHIPRLTGSVILKPVNGIHVMLKKRC